MQNKKVERSTYAPYRCPGTSIVYHTTNWISIESILTVTTFTLMP